MRVFPPKNFGLEVGESMVCEGTNYLRKHGISFFTVSSVVFFWDGTLASNQISPHIVADL
jgi:hypothetical protein